MGEAKTILGLRAAVCAVITLLAACGRKEAPPAPPPQAGPAYARAALDLDRPCSFVTAEDAAQISGAPFYRTIAANSVDGQSVRCAQGVGNFGLYALVEADVRTPGPDEDLAKVFADMCGPSADVETSTPPFPASQQPISSTIGETATVTSQPAVLGRFCRVPNGAYVLLLRDRVIELQVRLSAGENDPEATRRLASLVSTRVPILATPN